MPVFANVSLESSDCSLDDLLGGIDNRPDSDSIMVYEFFRLAAMWNFSHGEFVDLHALSSHRAEDGIPETSVRVVVFYREESSLCRIGTIQQCAAVDGSDTVEVDHPNGDAGGF